MRPVSFFRLGQGTLEQRLVAIEAALREIERASRDNDVLDLGQAFTISGTLTEDRSFDASSANSTEMRNVVATLISDMQKGGSKRT